MVYKLHWTKLNIQQKRNNFLIVEMHHDNHCMFIDICFIYLIKNVPFILWIHSTVSCLHLNYLFTKRTDLLYVSSIAAIWHDFAHMKTNKMICKVMKILTIQIYCIKQDVDKLILCKAYNYHNHICRYLGQYSLSSNSKQLKKQ